ncbi:MAG: hypothetical protein V1817_00200 [Candidatus Micrarchaeota archaeon]
MKIDVGAMLYKEIEDAVRGMPVGVIGFIRAGDRVVLEVTGC